MREAQPAFRIFFLYSLWMEKRLLSRKNVSLSAQKYHKEKIYKNFVP